MDDMIVRTATLQDAAHIADFNVAMALETEDYQLPRETVLSGVRNLFSHPELGFYVVAESGGKVIGCLLITKEWSD